jgi:NAD(P)-dependent dehydrogenase (short-subunit alcohol dehydrogenase family)
MTASGAVVITGASTGIGKACALHLGELGFRVFAGVRNEANAEFLEARASGHRIAPLFLDLTDRSSIVSAAEAVAEATEEVGLWGLVNNAGVAVAGPLEFLPVERLRRQLEVNVIGQIAVTQAFLPLLRKGGGRIVNIGSISGRVATPLLGAYAASKFAMEGLTDSLRRELRPWGIPVSIVEPGRVSTPIWKKSLAVADKLVHELPRRVLELYGPVIEKEQKTAIKAARGGIPAEKVAQAVAHALMAKRPRTRYLVGPEARLGALAARILPDSLLDRILTS